MKDEFYLELYSLSEENLCVEITSYLKYLKSKYFIFDPRDPKEDVIIKIFDYCKDEIFKNKIRSAITLCTQQENLFKNDPEFILSLLNLINELRVIKTKKILVDWIKTNNFFYLSKDDVHRIKNKIISIIMRFAPTENELKDLIESNISNPDYTDACLSASTYISPQFESFLKYFSIALPIYEINKAKVNLESVFRLFLRKIGLNLWNRRSREFFLDNDFEFKSKLKLLIEANLEPLIYNLDYTGDARIIELIIKWPFKEHEDDAEIYSSCLLNNLSHDHLIVLKEIFYNNKYENILIDQHSQSIFELEKEEIYSINFQYDNNLLLAS